jgi:hypothetical protein
MSEPDPFLLKVLLAAKEAGAIRVSCGNDSMFCSIIFVDDATSPAKRPGKTTRARTDAKVVPFKPKAEDPAP